MLKMMSTREHVPSNSTACSSPPLKMTIDNPLISDISSVFSLTIMAS